MPGIPYGRSTACVVRTRHARGRPIAHRWGHCRAADLLQPHPPRASVRSPLCGARTIGSTVTEHIMKSAKSAPIVTYGSNGGGQRLSRPRSAKSSVERYAPCRVRPGRPLHRVSGEESGSGGRACSLSALTNEPKRHPWTATAPSPKRAIHVEQPSDLTTRASKPRWIRPLGPRWVLSQRSRTSIGGHNGSPRV